jgi:hypothetical protein
MTNNRRQSGGRSARDTQRTRAPAVSVTDLGGGRSPDDTHYDIAPAFYIPGRGEGHVTRDTRQAYAFHRVQRLRRRADRAVTPTVCLLGGLSDTGMGMAELSMNPCLSVPSHPHKPGGPGAIMPLTPVTTYAPVRHFLGVER